MKIRISNRLRLSAVPPALHRTLTERLAFPNPKYYENQRMGRWNRGVKRVLRSYRRAGADGLFVPRGYMRQLILLCRRRNIAYELDDRRRSLPEIDSRFRGRLKPFQQQAAESMLARDFGTLNAPTGSGKTVIALAMIARRRQPALVVVHTRELARQWTERIEEFLGIAAQEVGEIGGGRRRLGDRLTVATVQSLYKCAREVSRRVGFLVVDECHRCPSRTFTEAVAAFDARYMLGLSATPYRRDGLDRMIFWHLGDVHHSVGRQRLVDSGDVLRARVHVRETAFRPHSDPVTEYSRMLTELTADDGRNRQIVADVAAEARSGRGICLVLSDRRRHCENLQALLRFGHDLPAVRLTGDLSAAERRAAIERVEAGESNVMVATGQLVGEGFDLPELATLFLATPVRFSGRLLQYLGRVLRPAPGKGQAQVYDYVDVNVEVLCAAARARQRAYNAAD